MVVSLEKKAEYNRRYYEKNREKILSINREYKKINNIKGGGTSEYNKKHYQANKEHKDFYTKYYRLKIKELKLLNLILIEDN